MADLTVKAVDIWIAVAGPTLNGTGPLVNLAMREKIPAFPGAYVLKKLRDKAVKELQRLNETREDICKELATKNEDGSYKMLKGGAYDIPDMDEFKGRFNVLLQSDVTLTGVRPIRAFELGSVEVSVDELDQLGPFLLDEPLEAA